MIKLSGIAYLWQIPLHFALVPTLLNYIRGPFRKLVLVLAVCATGLIIWGWTALVAEDPVWDLAWIGNGVVTVVDVAGPCAEAGLEVNDRILSVNGQPPGRMPVLAPNLRPGDQVRLEVARGSERRTLTVTLSAMSFSRRFAQGEKLLIAMVCLLVGLLIGLWQPDAPMSRVVSLLGLIAALAYATNTVRLTLPPGLRVSSLLELWTAALMLHACLHFANLRSAHTVRWSVRLLYGIAGLLTLGSLLIPALGNEDRQAVLWNLQDTLLYAVMAVLLVFALAVLYTATARSATRERKRRIVAGGMALALLPALLFSILPRALFGEPLVGFVWTNPFLLLIPLSFAYALYHGTVARIDRFAHNTSVYMLFVILTLTLFTPLFFLLSVSLDDKPWVLALAGAGVAVLVGSIFGQTRLLLQRGVDRLIFGGWHRYRAIVQQVNAALNTTSDAHRPVDLLFELAQTMRLKEAFILWPDGEVLTSDPRSRSTSMEALPKVPRSGALATYLRQQPYPLWTDELRAALPSQQLVEPERKLLTDEEPWLWVPLVSNETLHGLVVLSGGQKALIESEDLDPIATLAGRVALRLENETLNASLATRLQEVEAVRDELAEAQRRLTNEREQERRHLARELHDGPLQMMYGVRYQLDAVQDNLTSDAERVAHCEEAKATLQEVASTLRGICTNLRPPLLSDFGLDAALRGYAETAHATWPEVEFRLFLMPDNKHLPEPVRLALFRIAQEATQNAVRHGKAQTVTIHFELDAEQILLEIEDDGGGFNVPKRWTALAREGHLGLLGMSERAQGIGGTFEVSSSANSGTRVRVVVPQDELASTASSPELPVS